MILGLDASTSITGWAFCEGQTVVDAGFLNISKLETNKEKGRFVTSFLLLHPHISKVSCINLEAALSGFAGGFSSQQVIIKLSRFNAVLEYILSEELKLQVNLINVLTARKKVLGKARVKGMTGKEYVQQTLPKIHPEIVKFEKKNKKNEWDVHNGDMYDAVIVSCVI